MKHITLTALLFLAIPATTVHAAPDDTISGIYVATSDTSVVEIIIVEKRDGELHIVERIYNSTTVPQITTQHTTGARDGNMVLLDHTICAPIDTGLACKVFGKERIFYKSNTESFAYELGRLIANTH